MSLAESNLSLAVTVTVSPAFTLYGSGNAHLSTVPPLKVTEPSAFRVPVPWPHTEILSDKSREIPEDATGASVGATVGSGAGVAVGSAVGSGASVGSAVGSGATVAVGSGVAVAVGSGVAVAVGSGVAVAVGSAVGSAVGAGVAVAVGATVGVGVVSSCPHAAIHNEAASNALSNTDFTFLFLIRLFPILS